jgi:6-phosphogluconolactonase
MDIRILPDAAALTAAAVEEFLRFVKTSVALAGGSTPRMVYSALAARPDVPWNKIHFFWGDERHVPPDHADSNYRMAHEAMLSKVPVPAGNIHRIHGEDPKAESASETYAADVSGHFKLAAGQFPRFDVVMLGMGADGHTASLFPGTTAVTEHRGIVTSTWVEKFKTHRITLTVPAINNAACVMFVVSGADKAETLRLVLRDHQQPIFPSQLIRPTNGRLIWLVDQPAARLL